MPLKILMVHCYYQQRGGEDESFDAEVDLLRANGHEVVTYARNNDDAGDVGQFRLAASTIWSKQAKAEIEQIIREHRPDVMHCTNIFPLISPSIYAAAKAANVSSL